MRTKPHQGTLSVRDIYMLANAKRLSIASLCLCGFVINLHIKIRTACLLIII
jgi:hypothetical protein